MSDEGNYTVNISETEAGPFVEIHDHTYDGDNPAAFLSLEFAVEMAEAILEAEADYRGGADK